MELVEPESCILEIFALTQITKKHVIQIVGSNQGALGRVSTVLIGKCMIEQELAILVQNLEVVSLCRIRGCWCNDHGVGDRGGNDLAQRTSWD